MDEATLKRLRLRSWRRGMKEMDLILGPFADEALVGLPANTVADYENVLSENDQDLYSWVTGARDAPAEWTELIGRIRAFHRID